MSSPHQPLPRWVPALAIGATFVTLTAAEWIWSLRSRRECKGRRVARNLTVAAIAGGVMGALEEPAVYPVARWCVRRRVGVLRWLPMPESARILAAVILMDYSLYFWHVLTHRVPLLWKFHLPHHVDLDMDASTALRFHAGEMLFSVPFRMAQVLVLGASVRAYSCWQTATFVSILFHHSNLNLPRRIDDALALLVATPRLHGIHHDAVKAHTDSNWSSGLTLWDRLHGTFRRDVAQADVVPGVPAYQSPEDVTLPKVLLMPFQPQREDWASAATR